MEQSIFSRNIAMCWLFLFFSIIFEVCGTSFLKYSQDKFPIVGLAVVVFAISLSYFTLSKAIVQIPLGVAYAIWESAGLAFIVFISVCFLGENMDLKKASGLMLVFFGSILIHQGTSTGKEEIDDVNINPDEPIVVKNNNENKESGKENSNKGEL